MSFKLCSYTETGSNRTLDVFKSRSDILCLTHQKIYKRAIRIRRIHQSKSSSIKVIFNCHGALKAIFAGKRALWTR